MAQYQRLNLGSETQEWIQKLQRKSALFLHCSSCPMAAWPSELRACHSGILRGAAIPRSYRRQFGLRSLGPLSWLWLKRQ